MPSFDKIYIDCSASDTDASDTDASDIIEAPPGHLQAPVSGPVSGPVSVPPESPLPGLCRDNIDGAAEPPAAATAAQSPVFNMHRWCKIVDSRSDLPGGNGSKSNLKNDLKALRWGLTTGRVHFSGRDFAQRLSDTTKSMKKSHWRALKPKSLMTLLRAHAQNEAWHAAMRAEEKSPVTYSDSGGSLLSEISRALN